jgi:hypothetical protein
MEALRPPNDRAEITVTNRKLPDLDGGDYPRRFLAEEDLMSNSTDVLQAVLRGAQGHQEPVRTMSEAEAAKCLGMTTSALANRRLKGTGPEPYRWRKGQPARYAYETVHDWGVKAGRLSAVPDENQQPR